MKIKVLKPDGSPLADAKVGSSPNQYHFNGGSNILGSFASTPKFMMDVRNGKKPQFNRTHRYKATTDAQGIALLKDLPVGNTGIHVFHKQFDMRLNGRRRSKSVSALAGKVAEVEIVMLPKGLEVAGQFQLPRLPQLRRIDLACWRLIWPFKQDNPAKLESTTEPSDK